MLQAIEKLDYRFDINDRKWMFERVDSPDYSTYRKWKILTKKILNISNL